MDPFVVRDCALAAIATGVTAETLRELRLTVRTIHPGSIYYHFWGGLLRPRFDDPEYHNDFAIWARTDLGDRVLAERLGGIDPTDYENEEGLRQELIDIIEARLDELETVPSSRPDSQFQFIRSQIVVFDTNLRINQPEELAAIVPGLSASSIFYHFIDARRREPMGADDFQKWLWGWGDDYQRLVARLANVDPYFSSLIELREQLTELLKEYFEARNGDNNA